MKLEDALFNWLQIKIVADARPDDLAAHETERFFQEILSEDHKVENLKVDDEDEAVYQLHYDQVGIAKTIKFEKEFADQLLRDIIAEPKYNEQ